MNPFKNTTVNIKKVIQIKKQELQEFLFNQPLPEKLLA